MKYLKYFKEGGIAIPDSELPIIKRTRELSEEEFLEILLRNSI